MNPPMPDEPGMQALKGPVAHNPDYEGLEKSSSLLAEFCAPDSKECPAAPTGSDVLSVGEVHVTGLSREKNTATRGQLNNCQRRAGRLGRG